MSQINEAFARLESAKARYRDRAGCGFLIRLMLELLPERRRF
jgi:hypothetical protein